MPDHEKSLTNLILRSSLFTQARIPSLYSDFRQLKESNVDGFNANVTAWEEALSSATSARLTSANESVFVFESDESILKSLQLKDFGQPLAIDCVIHEAVQKASWISVDKFKNGVKDGSLLVDLFNWTMQNVFGQSREASLPRGPYVIEARQRVLKHFQSSCLVNLSDFVYSSDTFCAAFGCSIANGPRAASDDIQLLLKFMSTYHHDLSVQGDTIKFHSPSTQDEGINDQDTCIALLKSSIHSMGLQADELQTKASACTLKAKTAVSRRLRTSALAALQSKKLLEKSLSETQASRLRVEEVLLSIIQAKENVAVLELMERANSVLKHLNTATGGVDHVHDVMDYLHATQDEAIQIQNSLSEPPLDADIEQGALEELNKLIDQEQIKEAIAKQESMAQLPTVENKTMSAEEKVPQLLNDGEKVIPLAAE